MSLTDAQINALLQPLAPGRVRSLDGNSHLEAWDDRRWLLRIFGWGGFDIQTLECVCVSERSLYKDDTDLKGRHTVVYRAQVRLLIKDGVGSVVAFFDDGATGDGINQPSLHKAHDFAMKTALSQALKRCCVNLGDTFGLSLYDKGKAGQVTVARSLAHSIETAHEVREDVTGGELDEQSAVPEAGDTTSDIVSLPTAAPELPVSALPETADPVLPLDPEQVSAHTAAQVAHLREKVIAALQQSKREAAKILARLQVEAAQGKLMNEATYSPLGEPMTVNLLLDNALKHLARDGASA